MCVCVLARIKILQDDRLLSLRSFVIFLSSFKEFPA